LLRRKSRRPNQVQTFNFAVPWILACLAILGYKGSCADSMTGRTTSDPEGCSSSGNTAKQIISADLNTAKRAIFIGAPESSFLFGIQLSIVDANSNCSGF
jgi:hypothetical protein